MFFALGYIAGIATCTFVAVMLSYFRKPLITMLAHTETAISNAGPRAKGYIFEPEPEADITRREHVARNAEEGRDTPISELM